MQWKPAERKKDEEGNDYVTWEIDHEDYDFKVVVNFRGTQLQGISPPIRTTQDLESLASIIGAAMHKYKQLKPKIHAPTPAMQ